MLYTNSNLVTYTKISPNKTSPRNHTIDTITIHCYVGQVSVENAGAEFSRASKEASCNYVIGYDGRIGLIVDERDRSWCSSSASNDNRAITIECACNAYHPYEVNDKVMESLINLCADICKRNGIKELRWKGDKSLIGQVDKQNMTVHRWFAAKACPGDYLYNKHLYIAEEVNKKLGASTGTPAAPSYSMFYRVRKSWDDAASQIGAFLSLENAKKACIPGYSVYDAKGNIIYSKASVSTKSKLKIISDIKSIQTWLNTYYNTGLLIDGIYGSKTKAGLIKAWQREAGNIIVDGIWGNQSRNAASNHIIQKNSKGIFVTIWQAFLVCKGYNPSGIDSDFGDCTKLVTIAYQRTNGLTKDGIVGKVTWSKAFG